MKSYDGLYAWCRLQAAAEKNNKLIFNMISQLIPSLSWHMQPASGILEKDPSLNSRYTPAFQALLAALLFGASAPLSKLLFGEIKPVPLAAFLYLGSGTGGVPDALLPAFTEQGQSGGGNPQPRRPAMAGRGAAGRWNRGTNHPATGVGEDTASTASLLLNFEGVATTLIAISFFKESIDRRIGWAIGLVTLASIVLTWTGGNWGISLGALGIIGACFLWGLDNNFTRHISAKEPTGHRRDQRIRGRDFFTGAQPTVKTAASNPKYHAAGNAIGIHQLWDQHPVIHRGDAIDGSGTHQHPVWNSTIRWSDPVIDPPARETTNPILGSDAGDDGRGMVNAERKPRASPHPRASGP